MSPDSLLQDLIPEPGLLETEHFDVAVAPWQAYALIRHFDAGSSPLIHGLFSLRLLPEKLAGHPSPPLSLRIDDLVHPAQPGFRMLREVPEQGFAIGAIAQPWHPVIAFADAPDFAGFSEPGWAKIAWSIRCEPRGKGTRVSFELRVATTDPASWPAMRRYYGLIGPFSRLIRRHLFHLLERELGDPEAAEQTRLLPGDELLPAAKGQDTYGVTLPASPGQIWPWLVQMGCGRGGWYAQDWLDNGGQPSAERILPEFQALAPGQILAATPESPEGFEVLGLEPRRCLMLGSCFDLAAKRQVPFADPLPDTYWRVSWVFGLEALGANETRLWARVRVDYAPARIGLRLLWLRPLHALMQQSQLQHLRQRIEAAAPETASQGAIIHDSAADVLAGLGGAARMLAGLLTPFMIAARSHWGLSPALAARAYPGDELLAEPEWGWTHAVEIDAPAAQVWPWVAQIGQNRGGFYSYQWLENLSGCRIRNADSVHPEWQPLAPGDGLRLHPGMPPLQIVQVEPGRCFVAFAALDARTGETPAQIAPDCFAVSWLLWLEALDAGRCRLISRYRCQPGPGLADHLTMGPWLLGSIGYVMDRKMLLGIRARAAR